ncbi:hypothetical protein BDN70DRAFT_888041 [Pholiota conissans]|uniref:Uncharacterized protein n=1 Tax=Pholiota conissans TaxID=109636 RepID=A0A9P6CSX2_9AGAR|nr:hypothetical protein BDN70DRAFT_888041 [Pholiota conissans]
MVQVSHQTTKRHRSLNRRNRNSTSAMTQHAPGTTRSRTPISHSTGSNCELDNHPKESQENIMNEEDEEWVDYEEEPETRPPVYSTTSTDNSANYRASPRKRGVRKTNQSAILARKQGSVPAPTRPPPHSATHEITNEIRDAALATLAEGGKVTGQYLLSVLKIVGHLSRWPIAFGMTSFLLMIIMGYISTSIRRAFEPLCVIPGISSLSMCNPGPRMPSTKPAGNFTPKWADYSTLMTVQTESFNQLLGDTAGGSALALEVKKAEMATTDLITRVRISDLKARDTLATFLSEFVADAKKAGMGLQKLSSKVGGAVDNIIAVNDYALHSIANARANEPAPWSLRRIISRPASVKINEVVMRTFEEATDVLSANMERLIIEAERNLHMLNDLEERLATLHDVVAREDSSISSAKSDLLEDLWTKLGGNQKSLKNYERHLFLLRGLGVYRQQALVHVGAALQTLKAMSADMEDMRERVAAPELMGRTVPVEVHIKSIQMGLERLREGRIHAKKLGDEAAQRVDASEKGLIGQ